MICLHELPIRWPPNSLERKADANSNQASDFNRALWRRPDSGFRIQWRNSDLKVPHESNVDASRMLAASGFHRGGNQLYDSAGHPVRFSILTNSGNPARQKMAAMIQQDLLP